MKHEITLSPQCWLVLKRLADIEKPGELVARRIFPHPHKVWLSKKEVGNHASPMSPGTMEDLLRHHLIDARPEDAKADVIRYTITDLGRDVVQAGELTYDDENRDWFEEAS